MQKGFFIMSEYIRTYILFPREHKTHTIIHLHNRPLYSFEEPGFFVNLFPLLLFF